MALQVKEKESQVGNGKFFPRNMCSEIPMGRACIRRKTTNSTM
jgi:hypothetical protein